MLQNVSMEHLANDAFNLVHLLFVTHSVGDQVDEIRAFTVYFELR